MFHPIFNYDGRLSYFRCTCLLIAALCAGAYGWLQLQTKTPELSLSEPKEDPLLNHRMTALQEMTDAAAYLRSCGTINEGFVGCKWDFSAPVKQYYDAKVEAADDGFAITLKAKDQQLQDKCSLLSMSSNGKPRALDRSGKPSLDCIPARFMHTDTAALSRPADGMKGAPAPSGARPIITETAASEPPVHQTKL